jgi:hypothetical protein
MHLNAAVCDLCTCIVLNFRENKQRKSTINNEKVKRAVLFIKLFNESGVIKELQAVSHENEYELSNAQMNVWSPFYTLCTVTVHT